MKYQENRALPILEALKECQTNLKAMETRTSPKDGQQRIFRRELLRLIEEQIREQEQLTP